MKHIAFLFIMLGILVTPSAMAWESAVHAKGVQDICKAFGFSEAAAIRVGDGAWYDGNDIRLDRKEGEKGVSAFRNQDSVFNTGVLAEGTPVKTYGKFSISPNDTRYLSSRKYLNKAISLMKEENPGEALYNLGVGVRALQNIFANRDVVNDAAWTARGKMENGAASWLPGMAFDPAWHNVDADDDVFSAAHSDALKASLQATMDYVDEFLKACPKAVKNVRQPSASTVDGIVAETVSLIPLREKLAQKVKQTNGDIVRQLDKALVTFLMGAMAKAKETQPPYALTIHPARRLAMIAKVTFRRKLEDMKIDAEEFSGSADAEWKAFEKKTTDSLEVLLKVSDNLSKAMTEASAALKKASPEEGYMVARKQLSELSRAFFMSLRPYCEYEKFFDEQITYWVDTLNSQMEEYTQGYGSALLKNYSALKTQLPKRETAFADFMAASDTALKEYMRRCDNALVDFGQEMSAIAEAYGKNADALKKSAAECVSAALTAFDEKAKQTAESLKGIAPLKPGEAVPKAVDDVIRSMMKDANELKNNVFESIAPSVSDSRHSDGDPQKALRLLAAHATRQDFLRPIDVGSRRPASWTPAVWKSDAPLKITYVKRTPKPGSKFDFELPDQISNTNDAKSTAEKGDEIFQTPAKSAEATKDGTTQETTKKVAGDVAGATIGMAAEKALSPMGGMLGEVIGSIRPGGGQVGKKIGEKTGEVASKVIQRVIEREGGEYIVKHLDDKFGEGATEAAANDLVKYSEAYSEAKKVVDPILNTWFEVLSINNGALFWVKFGEKIDSLVGYFESKYILDPAIDMSLDAIFGEKEADSNKKTDNLSEDIDFVKNTLHTPTLEDELFKYIANTINEINKYDMDVPHERAIAMELLDQKLSPIKDFVGGIMDTISSFTLQIRGFMMGLINFAVDLEHIDISDKMNQSLQTLKSDLETMTGKDNSQGKGVERKATIENKGRDLKRTSNPGSDLKGAPSVKQIEMKNNEQFIIHNS
ncbi:MAG: hypothetical protein K6G44_10485 [Lentisphaeria bacterium]|nr:hypothetical protein [Lentisphaeria bacterium]